MAESRAHALTPVAPIGRLGLIGCGFIGGSFALAARRAGIVQRVVGFCRSPATAEVALRQGVLDEAAATPAQAVADCDVVVVAVPVGASEAVFKAIAEHVTPARLLLDVGATKREAVDAARRALKERAASFVPCHPLPAKERAGIRHAEPDLFEGRSVILTPHEQTAPQHLARAQAIWQALGAQVQVMDAVVHDTAFAAVNHLPHLIAFAYFTGLLQQKEADAYLRLAGPGFRDFTRIAAADPALWRDLLLANREEALKQSERFRAALGVLESALRDCQGEALEALIRGISQARAHWRMNPTLKR